MTTHKISTASIFHSTISQPTGLWIRYVSFTDAQKPYALAWWLGSLLIHGCILVPLTFLLVYSSAGPTIPFLFISMSCFFVNIIANMGSAQFRFTFSSLVWSIAIHAVMIIYTILITV